MTQPRGVPGAEQPVQAVTGYTPLPRAEITERVPGGLQLRAGSALVDVRALAPDLFRVGLFGPGRRPVFDSAALARTDWDPGPVALREAPGAVMVATASMAAHIALDPLRVRFEDSAGRRFAEDDPALGMGLTASTGDLAWAGGPVRLYKRRPPTERYFGCGERTGGLEKTETHQVFWNISPPLGHTAAMSNLYTSIPFVLALDGGQAWGLFLNNAGRTEFDLAKDDPACCWFGADVGDLIYYVFAGPSPRQVLERFTELTGRIPMPPLWALGYHQSRWSYMDAEELRSVAREFRARDIPCDALYLDIDYMDGFRVFTWDCERFPDPGTVLGELAAAGFKVVTIVDPGVKVDHDYPVYTAGRQARFFCQTAEGEEYQNVVWPGLCAFPDFTSARVRAWWGDQHRSLLEQGVAGIWCDMNEPALRLPRGSTMPPDALHPGDGNTQAHAQVHNLYGSLMARATFEGLQRLQPDRRPFVISRAGFAGLQRYALHWTGDNSSWWEHLWMSLPQLQNLGLSGLGWVGVDVGGFDGDTTAELLVRWTEFGIFQPFCRNHSRQGTRRQEPWAFGEPYTSLIRDLLKLRQRLLPYLYSLFETCHRTGAPILRPLLFEYPDDPVTYTADDEFLLGEGLLVAPIARPGTEYRHVYLPRGAWFQYWTGQRLEGPLHALAHAPLGQPAIYVRANTPIPLWPEMRHVGERPPEPLTLLVYPGSQGRGGFSLYEDAGDGHGPSARTELSCETSGEGIRVRLGARQGTFPPQWSTAVLDVRGLQAPPTEVRVDGRTSHDWQDQGDRLTLPLSVPPAGCEVLIRHR